MQAFLFALKPMYQKQAKHLRICYVLGYIIRVSTKIKLISNLDSD